MSYTFVDLFSGCGGFSHGFHKGGFKHLLAIDAWEAAIKTYRENFLDAETDTVDLSDSSLHDNLSRRVADKVDILLGGPPCQGFSTLGKRRDGDQRSTLVDVFAALCLKIRPKIVLVENVKGIATKRHPAGGTYADALKRALGGSGAPYVCDARVINATDFGVGQTRARWFLVAVRGDVGDPERIISTFWRSVEGQKMGSVPPLRDLIGDLPKVKPGGGADLLQQRDGSVLYNHRAMNHSAALVRRLASVPPGGGLLDVPRDLLTPHLSRILSGAYGSGGHAKNVYGRMEWDKPSGTIVAGIDKITCGRFVHPDEDRLLTPRECARIQTFPDDFRFLGTLVTQYYLIGNAVPPRLSHVMANAARAALDLQNRIEKSAPNLMAVA